MWETNCPMGIVSLSSAHEYPVELVEIDRSHYVYFSTIPHLTGNIDFNIKSKKFGTIKFSKKFPSSDGPLKIVFVADNQFLFYKFQNILLASLSHRPDLVIHGGDSVQHHSDLQQWETDFFDPIRYQVSSLLRMPWILVHGNHDYRRNIRPLYKNKAGWFAATLKDTRWIVLDSNDQYSPEQKQWFHQEIESQEFKSCSFRIVLIHIPPFIEYWEEKAWERGEKYWHIHIQQYFVPLFEQYNINLVISGHQHNYQRGSKNNITYIIAGGAGGDLDVVRVQNENLYRKTYLGHHFLVIDLFDDEIRIEARDKNDKIFDLVQILK